MIYPPDRIHFSIAFPTTPQPVVEVWRRLSIFLEEQRCLPKIFAVQQIAGHREEFHSTERLNLSPAEFEELITNRELDGFFWDSGISGQMLSIRMLHAKTLGPQTVLGCHIDKIAKAPDSWKGLLEILLEDFPAIGAWQWGGLYGVWQRWNEVNSGYLYYLGDPPLGYSKSFIKVESLTPQPDRVFIDIALNPGRAKELVPTVFFYPTAEMWLGPHFWQYAKCTKEEVLAADFFIEKRDTPHFLYLKCWSEPFSRPDGEQGRIQQRLWKLFFHEDCEWPPGSGMICDEPMYGPPELMPDYKPSSGE